MRKKSINYLIYSQASFFSSMLICSLLSPEAVTGNLGISFYGNYKKTLVPYIVGLFLTSYFIIKAASALQRTRPEHKIVSEYLIIIAVLIIAVSLTPYSVDNLFDKAHILTSSLVFLVELFLAQHIVRLSKFRQEIILLFSLQVIGALIAMVSLLPSRELMLTGQLISQMAFGLLLIRGVDLLTSEKV